MRNGRVIKKSHTCLLPPGGEHLPPVGSVRHLLFQISLHQPGQVPAGNVQQRNRLGCALIQPAHRTLGRAGDPHLEAGCIGQIHTMRLKTHLLGPGGITAGTQMVMTTIWRHHAGITLRQTAEAGIAIALAVTLARLTPTMLTNNSPRPVNLHRPSDIRIQHTGSISVVRGNVGSRGIRELKPVLHLRISGRNRCPHFLQGTGQCDR